MRHPAYVGVSGFTLIEIMIVIAIIAVLASMVLPNLAVARFESSLTACQQNCKVGLEAVQMAHLRKSWPELVALLEGGRYTKAGASEVCFGYLDGLVEAGYLERPLHCATTGGKLWFHFASMVGMERSFYRDWKLTQQVMAKDYCCFVYCGVLHEYFGEKCYPMYEESLGAVFN